MKLEREITRVRESVELALAAARLPRCPVVRVRRDAERGVPVLEVEGRISTQIYPVPRSAGAKMVDWVVARVVPVPGSGCALEELARSRFMEPVIVTAITEHVRERIRDALDTPCRMAYEDLGLAEALSR